ncbi:MAG: carbohydrate kinase [Lentisphaeria bacterium]|nr:carbohydrate kinase [Lentisphaeria bacterium]
MLYLGIDASTQGVKGVVIDPENGRIAAQSSVNFGKDLPQYNSPEGYVYNEDPLIKHADPGMWLDGLELMLSRLAAENVDMGKIAALSGSGQQHGSVYLNKKASSVLAALHQGKSLAEQLQGTFSRKTAPLWMDRSTQKECRELAAKFGNDLQYITGSPATERFTGPQIRKFYREDPLAYQQTDKIHLVSSFLCSVLIGRHAPIDYGDGAGMNLLDLHKLEWDEEIVSFTAPSLMEKLPPCVPSGTVAGNLSSYFEKYGLKANIPVIVWSGDNPCSLVGTGCAEAGTAGISLGTSDTVFATMEKYELDPEKCGHVMGNPAGGFMSLICFSNGSLARDAVRREIGATWEEFDALGALASAGSNQLMLPYFQPESTPPVLQPEVKYNFNYASARPEEKVKALLESQALSMRKHTMYLSEKIRKIRLTGGASLCGSFRQIIADVFQAEVETISVSNSAGLGAAMRSAAAVGNRSFAELNSLFTAPEEVVFPDPSKKELYEKSLMLYGELE